LKGRQHTREHKRTDGYIAIVEHKLGVPVQTHKTVPDFAGHVYHIVAHPVDSGSLGNRSVCLAQPINARHALVEPATHGGVDHPDTALFGPNAKNK